MKIIDKGRQGIRKILEECLALLFLLKDRRVHWYAKLVVLLPLAYIASPIDLIPDSVMFFGQIDDLIVVRFSYAFLKTVIDPMVLEECREQSRAFLSDGRKHRMKFAVAFSAIWIFLFTFLAVYLFKKIRRHGTP
jgi:uncharacterized membrane protein YkvA (DUF1232 family)